MGYNGLMGYIANNMVWVGLKKEHSYNKLAARHLMIVTMDCGAACQILVGSILHLCWFHIVALTKSTKTQAFFLVGTQAPQVFLQPQGLIFFALDANCRRNPSPLNAFPALGRAPPRFSSGECSMFVALDSGTAPMDFLWD